MSNYLRGYSTRQTPQNQPIPTSSQVENSAGGFAWEVDKWTQLHRFLILGSEGGTYYISEQKLTEQNASVVLECLKEDGARTVAEIIKISVDGRAPKNDPAIFALALAASHGDLETRRLACDSLPAVCRIGTHLFHFAIYVEQFRGWGRMLRRAVAAWYKNKELDALAYQVVKYRQRDGWSHRDLLRLSHPNPETPQHDSLYAWVVGKESNRDMLPLLVKDYILAQNTLSSRETVNLIRSPSSKLPREALQTEHLNSPEVWDALLDQDMPMTALIRNLATMTRIGLLTPTSDATNKVIKQLQNEELIRHARIHPIQCLSALVTYSAGRGTRSSNTWNPVPRIVDALDGAFYISFGNVKPTGKRWMLALDVSGSMNSGMVGGVLGLTPRVASSAMAMVTAASGDPYEVVAFCSESGRWSDKGLASIPFSPRQRLDDICKMTNRLPFGGTDCALPMLYAINARRQIDCFAIYTDSETWAGNIHPSQALVKYREQEGINAKLIVVGMTSNGFSIADPNDAGMLDVVGFDSSVPAVMEDFVA